MNTEKLNADLKNVITIEQAWYYKIVPFKEEENVFYYYAPENHVSQVLQSELEVVLNQRIFLQPNSEAEINQLLSLNYPRGLHGENLQPELLQPLKVKENGFVEF